MKLFENNRNDNLSVDINADVTKGVRIADPTAAETVSFIINDNPYGETDDEKLIKADALGRICFDLLQKAQRKPDPNRDDGDKRAEAVYFSRAMAGIDDLYGTLWKKDGFKTGAEYLDFMHDFFLRGGEKNMTPRLREFRDMTYDEQVAKAMDARKTMDFLKHLGGNAVNWLGDYFHRSGNDTGLTRAEEASAPEDVRAASIKLNARNAVVNPTGTDEEYAAATETVRAWRDKQYKERVRAAYQADLLAENAWYELSAILPTLSEDGAICAKALISSRNNAVPETLWAKFNGLDDEEKRLIVRARTCMAPRVESGFWNSIGDMGIATANIASSVVTAPWRMANKAYLMGEYEKTYDPGFDVNRLARNRQYLWQATGRFDAGGSEHGYLPQLQFEQICEDHGFVAEALIGAASTVPYMAAAAIPYVGVGLVALEAMSEMDDHVSMAGGDITDPDYLVSSAIFGALYAYSERLQVENLLGGVNELAVREAWLKGMWHGIRDRQTLRTAAVGTFSESVQEGVQNGIMAFNEALALKEDTSSAFAEGFVEDFVGSLGTMFVVEAGGMVAGHAKRSGFANPFTDAGREEGRAARSQDLAETYETLMSKKRLTDFEKDSVQVQIKAAENEFARLYTIWNKGGKKELVENGVDAVRAEEWDYYFNSLVEDAKNETVADAERADNAAKDVHAYIVAKLTEEAKKPETAEEARAELERSMTDLAHVREVWAQGAGIYMTDENGNVVDAGAKALEGMGFTPETAASISRKFHYERAAAFSPSALEGIRETYERRTHGKVSAAAALAGQFGGRIVNVDGTSYMRFDTKDGNVQLVQIVETDQVVDFDKYDEGIAVDVEKATDGAVTKTDWKKMTPEERRAVWNDDKYQLGVEGFFQKAKKPITLALPADPSKRITSDQAATVVGTININSTSKDAFSILDSSVVFHETYHAFSEFAQASRLWTKEDAEFLAKTYGQAKASGETHDEENAAEGFRGYLARRSAGAMTAEDEKSPFAKIYAAAAGLDNMSAERGTQEKIAGESENAFFAQLVAEANKPKAEPKPAEASAKPQTGLKKTKEEKKPDGETSQEEKETPAAPAAGEVKQKPTEGQKTWTAFTPTGNVKVSGHWAVLDLKDVIHSNNPLYAIHMRAQLRNRKDNKAEEDTRKDIVNNFQGERLLEAPDTANGAPIVFLAPDENGQIRPFVLSGNGRVLVLNELADRHLYDKYRNTMKKWAAENGIIVPEGETPILVRVIDDFGGASRDKVADLSNTNSIQQYTEEEQARADAEVVKALDLAKLYHANADGSPDMTPGVNDEFFSEFIRGVGDTSLYNSDRSLTQTARDRAQRALLAIAVGQGTKGRDVVKKLVEQTDTLSMTRQKNAAAIMAAPVAALEKKTEYAIGPDVSRAMADFMDFAEKKKAGKIGTFDEYERQQDLLDQRSTIANEVLKLFGSAKSAAAMAEYVRAYCTAAQMEDPSGGLFGAARTREEIWKDAAKLVDENAAEKRYAVKKMNDAQPITEEAQKDEYRRRPIGMAIREMNRAELPNDGNVADARTIVLAEPIVQNDGPRYSIVKADEIRRKQDEYWNRFIENLEKGRRSPIRKIRFTREDLTKAQNDIAAMVKLMAPYLNATKSGFRYLPEENYEGKTIFDNSSYGKTIENSLICWRTLSYIDFTDAIKQKLGRPMTAKESFLASQMLYEIATEPQCLYCYVSLDRKAYDDFLLRYMNDRQTVLEKYEALKKKDKKSIDRLYKEYLNGRKATDEMRNRFDSWIRASEIGDMISMADVTTREIRSGVKAEDVPTVIEERWNEVRAKYNKLTKSAKQKYGNSPEYIKAFVDYMATRRGQVEDAEKYAQSASWAKKTVDYHSYVGELLDAAKGGLNRIMAQYGLRFYSFSEFSPAFIVENMQQLVDAALRGVKGFAYTKKTDFARIFAPSGMNVNISTFGRFDSKGNMVMDERQGANWEEAKKLREQFPGVGIVFVATDKAARDWARQQDWIDVIIPFHIVRTGQDIADYYGWENTTGMASDKDAEGRKADIHPHEHKNDFKTFVTLARERNLIPRFSEEMDGWEDFKAGKISADELDRRNPGFMKLVNETRRSAEDTQALSPRFDLEAAKKSWKQFVKDGGYYGNWYKTDAKGVDKAINQVVGDILSGKTAKDVDYGRQDMPVDIAEKLWKDRVKNRIHGRRFAVRKITLPGGKEISASDAWQYKRPDGTFQDSRYSKFLEKTTGSGETSSELNAILDKLQAGVNVSSEEIESTPEWSNAKAKSDAIEAELEERFGFKSTHLIQTPEREELRNKIFRAALNPIVTRITECEGVKLEMNEALADGESYQVKRDHQVCIIIGLPSAGKSSVFANPLSKSYSARVCDSDAVKKALPEFNDGYGGNAVHEESSIIMKDILEYSMDIGENIVYPILGYKPGKLRDAIDSFKAKGYNVHLFFNDLSSAKATSRLIMRFLLNGRYLPLKCIEKVGDTTIESYKENKHETDEYAHCSNDVGFGEDPIIVESSSGNENLAEKLAFNGRHGSGSAERSNPDEQNARRSDGDGETSGTKGIAESPAESKGRAAVKAYAQTSTKAAEDALENYVAYFKLSHGSIPKSRTIARIGLSLGMPDVDSKRILKNAEQIAERMRGTVVERAAKNGDVGAAMSIIKREKDIQESVSNLIAQSAAAGGQLTHKGVGQVNALLKKRVESMIGDMTAANLADMEGDTGLDLAAEILANDPNAFDVEYRKAKGIANPEETAEDQERQDQNAGGAGADLGGERELSDADRYKRAQLLKEANEKVARFIQEAKARAADNKAKAEERRKRIVELQASGENGEGGASDLPTDEHGPYNPTPSETKADFKTPGEFAAFLRVWAQDRFAKTHGLTSLGRSEQDKLFAEFYRITARKYLQDLADKLLAPKDETGKPIAKIAKLGNGSRNFVNRRLQEMEKGISADRIERMSADIFAFINKAAIRVSRVDLVKSFKEEIRERFLKDPEFDEFKQDTERKVTGWVEEAARYICRVCDLSKKSINGDSSQLEEEYRRLHEIIDRRAQVYDESGKEVAEAPQEDAETIKANWKLALLDKYGAMTSLMPGQIVDLQTAAFQYLEDEAAKLEESWRETRAQQEQVRRDLAGAIVGPNGQRYEAKGIFNGRLFDALNGLIRLRLKHLTRFAPDNLREKADDAINSILVMLGDGETAFAKAQQEDRDALFAGLGQIFRKQNGKPDAVAVRKYIARMEEKIPVELSRQLSNQGFAESMTYGQMLQLLVSLEQRSFKDAIEKNGREGQAELIRTFTYADADGKRQHVFTPEDDAFVDFLRAFYKAKRDTLSAVTMRMVGHQVDSPDPLYCPIRRWIDDKARGLHADPTSRWDPISKIFSRRVESDRDFDESRTILGLFFENSSESAKLTAWAERGSFIRNVVTSVGFQAQVKRAFGAGELGKILKQLEATFNGGEIRRDTPGELAAVDKALNFSTYAYLGFNPLSAAKQTTSFTVWANALPGGFKDLWRHMTHLDREVVKHLKESDEYKIRYGNDVGSGQDLATRSLNADASLNPVMRAFSGAGMWLLKKGDFAPGVWIAQGVYKDLLDRHLKEGMDEAAADKLAITETFNMLEETQQSGRTYNTNMLTIEHGRIGRLLTQFATSPLQQLQYETQAWREWRDMVRYQMGEEKIAAARQKLIRAAVINHILLPAALNLVIAIYKTAMGEEPPWEKDGYHWSLLTEIIMGQFSRVFFLGAFADTTLKALFKRETPRAGQLLPVEGMIGMGVSAAITVHDLATMNVDNLQKDLERAIKSSAPTRVPYNLYRRLTGDADADRKAKEKAKRK